jgi:hypothetical protein
MRPPDNTPEHTYELVEWHAGWNKHKHVRKTILTEHEAHKLNRAFMMNQSQKRYVKQD